MNVQIVQPDVHLPACEVLAYYDQIDRDEWLALRLQGIGGSEAGVLLGYSKYATPLSLWAEKTGRLQPEEVTSEFAEMGTLLEPFIRRELVGPYLREKLDVEAEIVEPTAMYRSREWPWMLANVDGFVVDNRLTLPPGLEIKTGTSYQLREWGGVDGDEIPDRYYAQVQHYMAVLGLGQFYVFGVIGNQRLIRMVPRNEAFIQRLVEVEEDFWDRVMSDDMAQAPAPIGADVDLETVLALGDPRQDEVADLWGVAPLIAEHGANRDEIKRLTDRQKELSALIVQAMGDNKRGVAPTGKVTIVDFEKSQFDQKRLKTERPEIAAEYEKSIRVTYPRITTTEEA